ncbi:hypothetical protein B5M50_05910 [candidate division KSB1 bacterium 4484_219]|nr:MAG: hypothetical protein B5M50_05910 [candidate division KSB1 bacterium 4484_219]
MVERKDVTVLEPPVLRIEHIWKSFGKVQALKDVSFEVYKGDVLALLGDNGAGKSTLIKIISGNYRADKGKIYLNNQPVSFGSPAEARHAGIETVYQQSPVCLNASVTANFFIGRELCNGLPGIKFLKKRAMRQETEKAMADIGVHIPSVKEKVGLLSGGERQALILGRFFHWGGKIALLDEPFAALGVGEARKSLKLIQHMGQQMRLPIILITHNVEYAFEIATRFVVLRHGEMVGEGKIADVKVDDVVAMITGAIHVRDTN